MIISRTPYRISFFGGGTDYPAWYLEEGGAVLSTTIDKYCFISARYLPPFFNARHRIVWSHIENVSSIAEILHPAVREGLRYMAFDDSRGLEIHHQGDLPARSGMGSSSSFTVGLLMALTALRQGRIEKADLARKAMELEQNVIKENVGSQDQVAAAHGGFNRIHFQKDGGFRVEPVALRAERLNDLQDHLLLFFTGTNRLASEIAKDVVANFGNKRDALHLMRKFVDRAVDVLQGTNDLDEFGHLLHENWQLKRGLSKLISNDLVDKIYATARQAGAIGGKLLGAGGSGFMVFYTPPEKQAAVTKALYAHFNVPFRFENEGSTIIQTAVGDAAPLTLRRAYAVHRT